MCVYLLADMLISEFYYYLMFVSAVISWALLQQHIAYDRGQTP